MNSEDSNEALTVSQLRATAYDDSPWTAEESAALLAQRLGNADGWGHPSMDIYDRVYGALFADETTTTNSVS